jgi:hypothetical protein
VTRRTWRRDKGYERARQHIEDARRLSWELGGTVEDVKKYFFSLPKADLIHVLELYQHKYGLKARQWAEKTMDNWRTGRVQMSGQTASRLFNLLPPLMPPQSKYQLIENLWKYFGPSSKKRLRVGLDASLDQVLDVVAQHIEEVVVQYKIPENLERRFEWLSAGDAHVKQDLLNHFRQMEKSLVIEDARVKLPVMLAHLRGEEGKNTYRLAEVLIVGKHELELSLEKNFSGVALADPSARIFNSGSEGGWWSALWWVLGTVVVLYLMFPK